MKSQMKSKVKSEPIALPLKRRGMAEDVADRIRDSILSGAIESGTRINEVELASSLSVSRGPVRDAIVLLRHEGLLQGDWHRGSRVTVFTHKDLREIYSLRYAMELLAVQQLIRTRTDADLATLKSCAEDIESATLNGDQKRMLQSDIAFHDAIYACVGNDRLTNVWLGLRSQIALLFLNRQHGHDDYRELIGPEHWALYNVINDRNEEGVEELVRGHIETAFDRIRVDMGNEESIDDIE